MTEEIKKLKELIDGTDNIVFFGGAGVSTESGIPDFRSVDGLYHQQWDDPPETILSHTYYERYPEKFFAFYRAKLLCEGAKPNAAHLKLAEWEKEGKLKAVITQNIDGLHQAAGSKNVLELHGSTLRNYCEKCGKFYDVSYIKHSQGVPRCTCGGRIKPDVVLYEEGLDEKTLYRAVEYIQEADVLIIAAHIARGLSGGGPRALLSRTQARCHQQDAARPRTWCRPCHHGRGGGDARAALTRKRCRKSLKNLSFSAISLTAKFFIFLSKKRLTFGLFWAYNGQAVVERQPFER